MSTEALLQRGFTSPPITVPITTSPVQVNVSHPPYTVINLGTETDDTIWLADNPGVQISQGTPLYPGTSLLWNRPGRLWAIGESSTNMLVSYDVTDWEANPIALATAILNSGLILVDQPVELFNGNLDNTATDIFDITTYQSLLVTISPVDTMTYPGTLGRYDLLYFSDVAGTFQVFKRIIKFADNAGNTGPWKATIPCIGGGFRLSAVGTASGADIQILASHRPLRTIQQAIFGSDGDFIWATAELVTTGGAVTLPMPPYIGEVEVHCTATGAHGTSFIDFQTPVSGANRTWHRTQFSNPAGTLWQAADSVDKPPRIVLAGNAWRLVINNGDAADRTFTLIVTPVVGANGES